MFFQRFLFFCSALAVVSLSYGQTVGVNPYFWVAFYGTDSFLPPWNNLQRQIHSFFRILYIPP